jgi:hypothetical protein
VEFASSIGSQSIYSWKGLQEVSSRIPAAGD